MRAAAINEDHTHDIVEVPDPTPGPSDLILRVSGCGICGSDLKAVGNFPAGYWMGHEFAGEVVAVGPEPVGRWSEGDLVTALPLVGCGTCEACREGAVHHCATLEMIGVGARPGGYAEYVRVGSRETMRLPESVGAGLGPLVEPFAVALHAVERAQLRPGARVLVLGGGPVGMAIASWCQLLGAGAVSVSDPVAARRQHADRLGAGSLDPAAGPIGDQFADLVGGPPDVVFEAVGNVGMVQEAIDAARTYGTVVIAGVCAKPDPFVPVTALLKELAMHFVIFYRARDFTHTIRSIDDGRLDPTMLVTDVIGLDEFPAAFEALKNPTTQQKVIVTP